MIKYVEIALGSISNRGRAIPISEIATYQKQAQDTHQELYRSYYFFDHSLVDHLAVYKTVKGFNGSPFIELLTLDIDKNGDTDELVHKRAIAFFLKLKEFDISDINIRVYYSGSGYHFVLPNLWNFQTQHEVKETFLGKRPGPGLSLDGIFPECDSIYYKESLIRIANTINFKTNRYKIPLTQQELLSTSTENILQLALKPREVVFPEFEENFDLEYTKRLPKIILTEQPAIVLNEGMSPVIVCMQKLYNLPPEQGSRHKSIIRMVSAFKRSGVPRNGIETMLIGWSKGQLEIGEIRKVVTDVFSKNYQFSCEDEIMKKYCDDRCIFFKKKSYNATIPKDVESMDSSFRVFATTESTDFIELQRQLELTKSFKIYPSEFVVIWGDTGMGKSSLVQNWCINEPKWKSLYLNFEVGERLMYRRELQIAHGMTKFDILQHYSNPYAESLSGPVNHIHMVSNAITLPVLEQTIIAGSYRFIIVDTLGGIHVPGESDITQKTQAIAPALKQLAIRHNIIILAVHHIPKSKAEDSEGHTRKLTKHSGAGSAAIEHEADKIILLEGNERQPYRRISSAKARDESPFDTTMMFDAERTFRFYKEPAWQNSKTSYLTSSEITMLISPGQKKD